MRRWRVLSIGVALIAVVGGIFAARPSIVSVQLDPESAGVVVQFSRAMDRQSVASGVTVLCSSCDFHGKKQLQRPLDFEPMWMDEGRRVRLVPADPWSAIQPSQEYVINFSGLVRDSMQRPLWTRTQVSLTAGAPSITTIESARERCAGELKERFDFHAESPSVVANDDADANWWTCTAWSGARCLRVYVLPMGRTMVSAGEFIRPQGELDVLLVLVLHGHDDAAAQIASRWSDLEKEIDADFAELWQATPGGVALLKWRVTVKLIEPGIVERGDMPGDVRSRVNGLGWDTEAYDVVAWVAPDPEHPAGGSAYARDRPLTVGWYWGPVDDEVMSDRKLRGMAATIFRHEIAHLMGWEHAWNPAHSESLDHIGRPIASPELLGWTDTDGDGVAEIVDETPYGSRLGSARLDTQ